MGPPIKAWNETRNSPDNDDSTSHSLSLTSSLDKTGSCSPCVVDESKTLNTGSSPSNNTSSDNNNTKFYTSTNIDVNAPIRNNHDDFTSFIPPSVEADCRKKYQRHGRPLLTYRKWIQSSSQPPIFSPDTTAGQFFWSDNNDIYLRSLQMWPSDLIRKCLTPRSVTETPSDCATTTDNSQPPISPIDILPNWDSRQLRITPEITVKVNNDDDSDKSSESSEFHTTLNDFWHSQAPYNPISPLDSDDDEIPIGGKIEEEEDYTPTLTPPQTPF